MRAVDFVKKRPVKTLTIFDIDDTLFHTTAKIKVVKDGEVIRTLTNQEFNNYQLQPGEEFDFGEFRNAEKFRQESEPIDHMLDELKTILDHTQGKVIMLTARADFDDKETFLKTFTDHGIDMSRIHVHRAGNIAGNAIPAEKKAVWVRKYLETGNYNQVSLYDDSMSNLRVFKSLKKEFPDVDFDAYYITGDEVQAVESQTFEARKRRKRRYAAYGPGPYGWYGADAGYSGDGGGGDGGAESRTNEASYPGNIGIMELTKFFKIASPEQQEMFKKLVNTGEKKLAWFLIQKVTGVKLQGDEFNENWDDEDEVDKIVLVKSLKWPEIVNKVNSAMKAMGWKGQRKDDNSFMFSTKGMLDDEWYIVIIENRGNNVFTYALGTVEEGDPHIGEQESLPMSEASVSELMDAIREGFGLNEQALAESSINIDDQAVAKLKATLITHKSQIQKASGDEVYNIIDKMMTRIAKLHNISGKKLHDMWVKKYKQVPDTWIMKENFADGKNPQDKGDSKRHGVPTKASVSTLRKVAKQGGRKGQLAHWMANMKSGKQKSK
jgi:hypothetical protein